MSTQNSRISGPWGLNEIASYLSTTVVPIRLSVINKNSWPIVLSLWFLYEEGQLLAASSKSSKIVEFLDANPRCGFEIARETPPYCGVRGYGVAVLTPDQDARLLTRLSDRYLGAGDTPFRQWLISRGKDETAISITPKTWMSWDYRARMQVAD